MSEIAIREESESAYLPTSRLVTRAFEAKSANQLAQSLCKTDFVPASMKDVGNATAAIIMGDELGFTPLASLRSIYVVHGTPALYARAMVALVLSQGHELWTESSTSERVEVHGRRKGSDKIEKSVWTVARATKAGYTKNAKYQTNPEEMLFSKASAEICRKIGADVLLGIPYSVEELELEDQTNVVAIKREPSAKLTIARASAVDNAQGVDEPSLDEEPEVATIQTPGETTPTRADLQGAGADFGPGFGTVATVKQVGYINSLAIKLGMTERETKLAYISDVIERKVASSKEISTHEAKRVIEYLLKDEAQAGLAEEAKADGDVDN